MFLSFPPKFCDDMVICFVTLIDKSFKVDGGIGGFLGVPDESVNDSSYVSL
jgi:hypothetical protein